MRYMIDDRDQQYVLTKDEATILAGLAGLPRDFRREAFERHAELHGLSALAHLFAEFMGLANSVVANNREAIELFEICENGTYPETAAKLNLPTILGACIGAGVALGIKQDRLCVGCAFRHGTCANQSPVTASDAEYCARDGTPFYCHENHDEAGNPTNGCVGFARARQHERRAA